MDIPQNDFDRLLDLLAALSVDDVAEALCEVYSPPLLAVLRDAIDIGD